MNGKEFAENLRSRKRVYGTCLISPSPHWPTALRELGLDFVFIDSEHIAQQRETLAWMCRTYRALNLAPLVRIPAPDPYQATMVLDGGAEAVLAPYIESAEQVQKLRGAVKFRPLKGERLERALHDPGSLEPKLVEYLENRNSVSSLLINIESVPAIEALDEILAVPDLDGVVVGPHDLSCSLGIPEQYKHPRFEEAIRTIIGACVKRGISMGVHVVWDGIEQQVEWEKLGANILLHSADLLLFRSALKGDLTELRRALGEVTGEIDDSFAV
jgi:staphyloferrin B biosynthesis citrate synthase